VTLALAVALAAGLGAALRYAVDVLVQDRHSSDVPWGTFSVNATGSLVLGVVTGLALRDALPQGPAVVLSAGLAGGYTTLSTWAWETWALVGAGARLRAAGYAVGTLAACLAAAAVGLGLGLAQL
jgi:fluoride exporter